VGRKGYQVTTLLGNRGGGFRGRPAEEQAAVAVTKLGRNGGGVGKRS